MSSVEVRRARRWLPVGALALGLLAAGAGCDRGAPPAAPPGKPGGAEEQEHRPAAPETPETPETPAGFARMFLKSLAAGTAKPEWVADEFRKIVAPPALPSEKEAGHSETDLKKWLASAGKGAAFEITSEAAADGVTAFRGTVRGVPEAAAFSLRVRREGEGGFRVVWFQLSPVSGAVPSGGGDPALLAARETARDLLEALLGGKFERAEALMTAQLRERLGGRPTAADEAAGWSYNRGFLRAKLKRYGGFASYAITEQEKAAGGQAGTFRAELRGKDEKQTVSLTVGREGQDGEWRVQDFREE